MLPKKILPFFILLCSLQTSAQRIIIDGEETLGLLKWSDFRGSPDHGSSYFAYTFWNITCKFDAFQFKGDTVKWQVKVIIELGKNSWRKKDKVTDTLLKHEQGHFDIGIICAMELQQKINNIVFLKNDYQTKLNAANKEVIDKYKLLTIQYDEETNHSANREQQWKWDAFFASKVIRLQ